MVDERAPALARGLTAHGRVLRRGRIFARLREGWAYDEIAAHERLTAERVRQIVRQKKGVFLFRNSVPYCRPNLTVETGRFSWYQRGMSITLTPEQETWIKAHVATGDFASVEEAARQLIDDRIAELAHDAGDEHDDMAWAKPLVDEGLAALERGDFITLEEHRARNAARLAARK